jgi:hypothetical protein
MRDRDVQVELFVVGFAGTSPQKGTDRGPHLKRIRLQCVRVVVEGLVLQVRSDRQICNDIDAERRQIGGRADAGAQEDRRAATRARGQDHLAGGDLSAACRQDPDRTGSVEQQAIDVHTA